MGDVGMGDVGNYRNLFHTACQRGAARSPWVAARCERLSAAAIDVASFVSW